MNKDLALRFYTNWQTPNTYDINFCVPPKKPGVYLLVSVIDNDFKNIKNEILYIGSSKNLFVRYNRHEVRRILSEIYPFIMFYFKEELNYKNAEIKLIKKHKPRFNVQHV